jgi:regulator of protease activity HflC (stomatin/prohibitin superfamily)
MSDGLTALAAGLPGAVPNPQNRSKAWALPVLDSFFRRPHPGGDITQEELVFLNQLRFSAKSSLAQPVDRKAQSFEGKSLFNSIIVFLVIALAIGLSGVKIFKEYERGVVFRLGRLVTFRGPGLSFVIPFVEKMVRVDLRTLTMNVPAQDVITRDNVSVKVAAVLYFRVLDPSSALTQVENYLFATSQLAQTTLRSVCGQAVLDEILSERERINAQIQEIVDAQADPWGIKVSLVAVKDIDLPQEMQRALAKQAEAERERRAKVIHAQGEFQAAQKLSDAAEIMAKQPAAFHLRFLQALAQVAVEKNHTVIVPIPIDLLTSVLKQPTRA